MSANGIDTPSRQAAFLGQVAVESANLTRLEENLNYSASRLCAVWPSRFPTLASAQPFANNPAGLANKVYGGRMGNTLPTSGYKYRGRGLKQLTGYDNYNAFFRASGIDVVRNPDLLLNPAEAAASAAWFWQANNCNVFADRSDIEGLTRRINGGLNGLQARISQTSVALRALTVA
jgi:putative chitinase